MVYRSVENDLEAAKIRLEDIEVNHDLDDEASGYYETPMKPPNFEEHTYAVPNKSEFAHC